jgi:putative phosphoribosyl transferase
MADPITFTSMVRAVRIPVGSAMLNGDLRLPHSARGIVLFAHGSGSDRLSPRNQYVANVLNEAGFATLLVDLLTREEESYDVRTRALRFDIPFLADRLMSVVRWLREQPVTTAQPIGLFGASTGAAAALIAAARLPLDIAAVVSRGGRPDLATSALAVVDVPTLLIVGGEDFEVLALNRLACARMKSVKQLMVLPGATHLFEESGALEDVARLARDWFERYLVPTRATPAEHFAAVEA